MDFYFWQENLWAELVLSPNDRLFVEHSSVLIIFFIVVYILKYHYTLHPDNRKSFGWLDQRRSLLLSSLFVVFRSPIYFVLFSVANGSVLSVGRFVKTSPNSCVTSQMKLNTTCSFSCPHQGYQVQGPSYKQCGSNGQWTDSAKFVSCQVELKIITAAMEND